MCHDVGRSAPAVAGLAPVQCKEHRGTATTNTAHRSSPLPVQGVTRCAQHTEYTGCLSLVQREQLLVPLARHPPSLSAVNDGASRRFLGDGKSRAEYMSLHKDERRTYWVEYYAVNKDVVLAKSAAWYAENKHDVNKKGVERRRRDGTQNAHYYAQRSAGKVERVSLDVLFERDKGICSLCHDRVKRSDASRDHVVPLSRGGDHSYQNCVLAHRRCNSRKGNRNNIPQQQRLF